MVHPGILQSRPNTNTNLHLLQVRVPMSVGGPAQPGYPDLTEMQPSSENQLVRETVRPVAPDMVAEARQRRDFPVIPTNNAMAETENIQFHRYRPRPQPSLLSVSRTRTHYVHSGWAP
jgi:hypothetical protein